MNQVAVLRGKLRWDTLRCKYTRDGLAWEIQTPKKSSSFGKQRLPKYRVVRSGRLAVSGTVVFSTNNRAEAEAFLNKRDSPPVLKHGDAVSVVTTLGGAWPFGRHWAIYDARNGGCFIEFQEPPPGWGRGKGKGVVRVTPAAKFRKRTRDLDLRVEDLGDSPFTPHERVIRAHSLRGTDDYDLIDRNCESFVREVFLGERISKQTQILVVPKRLATDGAAQLASIAKAAGAATVGLAGAINAHTLPGLVVAASKTAGAWAGHGLSTATHAAVAGVGFLNHQTKRAVGSTLTASQAAYALLGVGVPLLAAWRSQIPRLK